MKVFKRTLSLLLTFVLILTTLSMGLTSLAKIDYVEPNTGVTVIVPELIYLKPGSTSFQYYLAGASVGAKPASATESYGSISVILPATATDFKVTHSGAASISLSKTTMSDASTFNATISNGSMSSYTSGVITWTFTYTIAGKNYTTYAYTYVYAPFLGQTGANGAFKYQGSWGSEPTVCATAMVLGIHDTNGGKYTSLLTGTDTSTKFCSPLIEGWGNSNVQSASDKGFISSGSWTDYFPEDPKGGYSDAGDRTRDKSHDWYYGNANGYGILTIDGSRYAGAAYNTIPNFQAAWMVHRTYQTDYLADVQHFKATEGGDLNFTTGAVNISKATSGEASKGYAPADKIPSSSTKYTIEADFDSLESKNASNLDLHLIFGLQVNIVDKSELRELVNGEIAKNLQSFEFPAGSTLLTNYQAEIKKAATVLGNPTASATDITTAVANLKKVIPSVATYTVTEIIKLPATNGFSYTYDNTSYTASDGYITITDTQRVLAGSDVTITAKNYTGYTLGEETSVKYTSVNSDITKTFTYTQKTNTIKYNYGSEAAFINSGKDVTTVTVKFGDKYPAFPTPKMDGWRFDGWKNSLDNSAPTFNTGDWCKTVDVVTDLTANFTCWFNGGHGTAENPFLIANETQLKKISDNTAFVTQTNGSYTSGKYFTQTADFSYTTSQTAVAKFDGIYNGNYGGQSRRITIPASADVAGSTYGSIFGETNGATIQNLTVNIAGKLRTTGSGTLYSGFVGKAVNTNINNIQVTFSGTVQGGTSGILVGSASGTTKIENCGITTTGGTVTGDAFIGAKDSTTTLKNTWVLLKTQPSGYTKSSANNLVHVRENGTASLTYSAGSYTITAAPNSGWTGVIRTADDTYAHDGVYTPAVTTTGEDLYVCFTKNVTIGAGSNGDLSSGKGTYSLRQGQTVTNIVPKADEGYRFGSFTNSTNGTISASSPYTFTMGTDGGTITANFTVNTYTLKYNAGRGVTNVIVPSDETHTSVEPITIATAPTRDGWRFLYWTLNADGTGTQYTSGQKNVAALSKTNGATVTLYANWEQLKYTVSFDAMGGTSIEDMLNVIHGTTIVMPTSTRTGYKNLMWYTNTAFTGSSYPAGGQAQIKDNSKFYAKWTPISYTISFEATGASNEPASITATYDATAPVLGDTYKPVKTGYDFTGWLWDANEGGNGQKYLIGASLPKNMTTTDGANITLHATWTQSTYTVTWNLGGGTIGGSTSNPTTQVKFGGTFTVPNNNSDKQMVKSGCAFKGWYTAATGGSAVTDTTTVSITGNTTIYAQWNPATYTVAFNANGGSGTMANMTVTYGKGFTLTKNAFVRSGYAFAGWSVDKTLTEGSVTFADQQAFGVTGDLTDKNLDVVTLFAQWTLNKYTIVYNQRGGNAMLPNQSYISIDSGSLTLRSLTKEVTIDGNKYVLYGWAYSEADAAAMTKAYNPGASFQLNAENFSKLQVNETAKTITLYAVWAMVSNITWNANNGKFADGSTTATSTITYGSKYVLPEVPTRNRYTFVGWYDTPSGGVKVVDTMTHTNQTPQITYYAIWQLTGSLNNKYTVQYFLEKPNGGYPAVPTQEDTERTGEIGTSVSIQELVFEGYELDTSSDVPTVKSGIITDCDLGEAPLVLRLYYKAKTYSISFDSNGGTGTMAAQSVVYNRPVAINSNAFQKVGHTFVGWSLTKGGAYAYGDHNTITPVASNITLYAMWDTAAYTISFNPNGGSMEKTSITEKYGTILTWPKDPTRVGHTFNGWKKNLSDTVFYTAPTAMPAENVSLIAAWTPNTYKVTFDANTGSGAQIPAQSVVYGTTVNLIPNTSYEKTGYSFLGWATSASATAIEYADGASITMGAKDIALYAVWKVNSYTISFNANGGSFVASISENFGTPISKPKDPERTGYSFQGWTKGGADYTFPATMPAGNVELTAKWSANTYVITFNANGGSGTMATQSIVYATEGVTLNANKFSRTGYQFRGWSTTETGAVIYADKAHITIGASDMTLYAVWQPNTYYIEFKANGATEGTVATRSCLFDETYNLPENTFKKTGAKFEGWSTTENGMVDYEDQQAVTNLSSVAGDYITLYAVWTDIDYTITFVADDITEGEIPEEMVVHYGNVITIPEGSELRIETEEESRNFIKWVTDDGTGYTAGSKYSCPASDVTFTAVWSANYSELHRLAADVQSYKDSFMLPASAANDPDYAEGGEIAEEIGLGGMYPWDNFETADIDTALANAILADSQNLPQDKQDQLDALVSALQSALDSVVLKPVNLSYAYGCTHNEEGFADSEGTYYPPCTNDSTHSYNSLMSAVESIIAMPERTCLYTAESVEELRLIFKGNGANIRGYEAEVRDHDYKMPYQDLFESVVDRMASSYHSTLVLKDADYSRLDSLLTEYLPSLNGVTYENLYTYYAAEGASELQNYYMNIDRTYKNIYQAEVDTMYTELKALIDALVPNTANYLSIFGLILNIPHGTPGFSYPATEASNAQYRTWMDWAKDNEGSLSQMLDNEYLEKHYTAASVAAVGRILDSIDWDFNIFDQSAIDGEGNIRSYFALLYNAVDALQERLYTVTFSMNNDTDEVFSTNRGNSYGDAVVLPDKEPVRSDFVFKGWSYSAEELDPVKNGDEITTDLIVYAYWESVYVQEVYLTIPEGSSTIIDQDRKYITGLKFNLTVDELVNEYLAVVGNGHIEVVTNAYPGTGTVVNVINDYTGEIIDSFKLIVYGDLNGDGIVNASDVAMIRGMIAGSISTFDNPEAAYAANMSTDSDINATDVVIMRSIISGMNGYNQATKDLI